MNDETAALAKVPAVTLGFWIIKILATTLGETGGDTVTMSWLGETTAHPVPNGYLIGTAIFGVLLVALVIAQIRARKFNPWLYWATIVASTTCGTTLADFADRSLGIGYPGRLAAAARLRPAVAVRLVQDARHGRREHGHRAARRDLLLDHDHLLADARHRARRLGRRCRASAIPAAPWCSARASRCSRSSISRRASAACCCSGPRSSSPGRSARRSATSSTSRSPRAAWR